MHITSHPLYACYSNMIKRCLSPKNKDYLAYGGRGITVCDRWLTTQLPRGTGFWNFVEDMPERPDGFWLDREDNDGDYTPSNCRWATPVTQCNNRRSNVCKPDMQYISKIGRGIYLLCTDKICRYFRTVAEAVTARDAIQLQ